jgi:arabinogalactan oligomer / maltooligosaccharide transport system substrate-binding protein
MNQMQKTLGMLLVALALLAPDLAPAATKVVVWHAYRGKERTALEQVAQAFNQKQAEIQIELLPIPYDAFPDKVTAAIPRDKGPDLFIFAQDRLGDWAVSGLIESVDFWADDALRAGYFPETIKALTYDQQLYALPMAFKMVALFYNTKLLAQPPKTTNELVAAAKKATDAKAGQYGLVYENANFYYQAAWLNGFGGAVFDAKGNPVLDSKESIASMEFAQDLAWGKGIMPQEVSSTLVSTLFNQGKAAMVINGPWFAGEVDEKLSIAVATMPVISKVGKPARPFLTAEGVIMSAKCKDKKAAFEVMKALTSDAAGLTMATVGRQTSARKAVYDDAKVKTDGVLMAFKQQLVNTVAMPNTPAMRMVWSPATTAMNKVINGKGNPAEAMKVAQEQVAGLVKSARR